MAPAESLRTSKYDLIIALTTALTTLNSQRVALAGSQAASSFTGKLSEVADHNMDEVRRLET